MKTVRDIVKEGENHKVFSVLPDQSVLSAAQYMRLKNVGAAAVMRDNVLLGIVTERDMINKVLDHGLDPRDVPVERIMSRHLTVVSPEDSLKDCVRKLRLGHFRHLPVVEEGEIIGMISVRDILGADAGEQLDRYLWDREGRS